MNKTASSIASAIFLLIFLLIFLICGFCSVYCFLAVDAGHFHMFGVFGIIVGYIFGWISLIGLFIAIAFYRKKKAKA